MANTKIPAELSSTPGIIDNSNATAITIDSSENVGIGTTSPTQKLYVKESGTSTIVGIFESVSSGSYLSFEDSTTTTNSVRVGAVGNNFVARAGGSEAMRIDSSGNLLVGTTDTSAYNNSSNSTADNGLVYENGNALSVARYNNPVTYLNRTGSDGTVLEFRKSGSTVGSIGTVGGDLAIYSTSSTHAGLRFLVNGILPTNNAGTINDNTVDLGGASNRFKDLYLSGGVHLGGTGSANELDDYEEGTWTPNLTFGGSASGISWNTQSGSYVKIGSVVHLFCLLYEAGGRGSQTGNAQLTGLPFATSASYPDSWIPLTNRSGVTVSSDEQLALFLPRNTQSPTFYISRTVAGNNTTATHAIFSASGVFEVSFTLTYRTDS